MPGPSHDPVPLITHRNPWDQANDTMDFGTENNRLTAIAQVSQLMSILYIGQLGLPVQVAHCIQAEGDIGHVELPCLGACIIRKV
jgi:hypothetical protein